MDETQLQWDIGTGYDFFVSLVVLHAPTKFGLRAAWAAGMRQRLPSADRELLEDLHETILSSPPMAWIHGMPGMKDAPEVLDALKALSPVERLFTVGEYCADMREIFDDVAAGEAWTEDHVSVVKDVVISCMGKKSISTKYVHKLLDTWARAGEYGERLPGALRSYYEVFFAEEERRIRPALEEGLARAKELAEKMPLTELLIELSQGVHITELHAWPQLTLVPSFWGSPYVFFGDLGGDRHLLLFGARPADASVIPGEVVPDSLINALKALADPTRLKILRYLAAEPLTPTQLARRLRLRAPTVVHHLQAMRTAGLVYIMLGDGKEKSYQARMDHVLATCEALQGFLTQDEAG